MADLVQNAIEADATRIDVRVAENDGQLHISVADNGCGISPEDQARVWDPFHTDGRKHRRRKAGLGLAFLKQTVEATGGSVKLDSARGRGTTLTLQLDARHMDLPPLGDLAPTLVGLMAFEGAYELTVERERNGQRYGLRRSELADALGGLDEAVSLAMAKDYVASQEEALMRKGHDNDNDT